MKAKKLSKPASGIDVQETLYAAVEDIMEKSWMIWPRSYPHRTTAKANFTRRLWP